MKKLERANIVDKKKELINLGCVYSKVNFDKERDGIEFVEGVFEECSFKNYSFNSITIKAVEFEKCTFENCNFSNCKVESKGFLRFYSCNLKKINVKECFWRNLYITETKLEQVNFKDTFMAGCILSGNSYEQVRFEENCNLMDSVIKDNYKNFDISFINEKSYTKLNYGTYIGRYNYRKLTSEESLEIEDKAVSLSISSTYMDLGGQFLRNNVSGKYGICFYEGKRAFHRTLTGKRKLLSNIYNIVCGYGEKPSRTFGLSLVLIIFFAILYMFAGLKTFSNEVLSVEIISGALVGGRALFKLFIYSIYFSTVTFATVGYGDIMVVNGAGMIISIVEIIIGVFMIGVWTSTLVRKMTR